MEAGFVRQSVDVAMDPTQILGAVRYETLPFGSVDQEAAQLAQPLTLTVTSSPKHGNDHTVQSAARLRALGHTVVAHLSARMVRSASHLDELIARMREADVHDVFAIGGDHPDPLGPYPGSYELVEALRAHRDAPRTIGVAAYPEGHPLINELALREDLRRKAPLADYVTTQLCFHPEATVRWLQAVRADGINLPAYVGLPGIVDRRRLLEISLKVGVGSSISFLRKQHGVSKLAGRSHDAAEHLHDAIAPLVGGELGIAGLHMYTFNNLLETVAFVETREAPAYGARAARHE